jgi:hypothetical protein
MSRQPVLGLPEAVGRGDPVQHTFGALALFGCSPCADDEIGASDELSKGFVVRWPDGVGSDSQPSRVGRTQGIQIEYVKS